MTNPLIRVIFCISLIVCISINYIFNPLILILLIGYATISGHVTDVFKSLIRIRWILFTILLITSINQPGELIQPIIQILPFSLIPTYEGVYQGLLQSIRLICLMLLISLMTLILKREQLISAYYQLLTPLSLFKLDIERAAARLCLTLEYMQKPVAVSEFLEKLDILNNKNAITSDAAMLQMIELEIVEMNRFDFVHIFFLALLPFVVNHYQS